jgi:hypothetical protein
VRKIKLDLDVPRPFVDSLPVSDQLRCHLLVTSSSSSIRLFVVVVVADAVRCTTASKPSGFCQIGNGVQDESLPDDNVVAVSWRLVEGATDVEVIWHSHRLALAVS